MKAWERRCKQCEKFINNNSHDNTKEITSYTRRFKSNKDLRLFT